ncbi:DEAD/DEAH box helicase family protein [soil metagenome]
MTLNENQTRKQHIDGQITKAGWNLLDSNQVRFEVPASGVDEDWFDGITDYSLYLPNGEIIAVIEAKRQSRSPQTAREQAKLYAIAIEKNQGFRPFVFLANGNEIWFWDTETETPREIAAFFTRSSLERLLAIKQNRQPLSQTSINAEISGRSYQQEAIRRVAESFEAGKRKALLVMATGTGKTRTAMGLIGLFLRTQQAEKVLFLADRDALVDQALTDGFRAHLPDEPNDRIYTHHIDQTKRLYVATLQTMTRCFEEFDPAFFDLIIFDEAHRSIFNKLGVVMEYFDARMIGLTATPAGFVDRDTFLLFDCLDSVPTYVYPYKKAVDERVLVDYSLYKAQTGFQRNGIKGVDLSEEEQNTLIEQGIDPDDLDYAGTDIEKTVSNKETLRKQWEEFWDVCYFDESGLPCKTIVFAMTQQHAERLMIAFEEMFPQYNNLCRVITFDTERVRDGSYGAGLITQFKKENEPRIAISVDMLDTGIDVPEVCNLVFMKPVRSQIKLWQMIGRGTRNDEACKFKDRLPNGRKTEFKIIDFWENEFDRNAEENEKQTMPVLVRLFNTRLKTLRLLLRSQDTEEWRETVTDLREMVERIPRDTFQVKRLMPQISQAWDDTFWGFVGQNNINFLESRISPLLRFASEVDVSKETFANKVERLKLQVLTGKDTDATVEQIAEDISLLPPFVQQIPECKEAIDLIASTGFENAGITQLNRVIRALAPQMKFRQNRDNVFQILDLPDFIAIRGYITLTEGGERIYVQEYKDRVERRVKDIVEDHPTIAAIRAGNEVTDEQLIDLERRLRKDLSVRDVQLSTDNILKAYGWRVNSFLGFMRHLLELEELPNYETIVVKEFDEFITEHHYTGDQILFLRTLQTEFLKKNKIEMADLYDLPSIARFGNDAVDRLFTEGDKAKILRFTNRIAA